MEQHRSGRGAAMLRAANEQGIEYEIIKVVTLPTSHQARLLEVRLKARKNHRSLLTLDWQEKMDESIIIEEIKRRGADGFLRLVCKGLRAIAKMRNEPSFLVIAEEIEDLIFYTYGQR
jgi:siroheme synthase